MNLIGSTRTDKGLAVHAELDTDLYQKGIKTTDDELGKVNLKRDVFHGEWNYAIAPNSST